MPGWLDGAASDLARSLRGRERPRSRPPDCVQNRSRNVAEAPAGRTSCFVHLPKKMKCVMRGQGLRLFVLQSYRLPAGSDCEPIHNPGKFKMISRQSHHRQTSEDPSHSTRPSPRVLNCIVSSLGIGLFGAGLGAILAPYIAETAALIALLGLTVHLVALIRSVRRRRPGISGRQLWLTAIYLSCWTILIVLSFGLFKVWF